MKSNHYYGGKDIPFEELKYFVEPLDFNIQIPYRDLENILDKDNGRTAINYVHSVFVDVYNRIPSIKSLKAHHTACITYNTHLTGYDFRFNPIDIFNNIYKRLQVDCEIPFINLDNDMGMDFLKEYVKNYNRDILRQKPSIQVTNAIHELNSNIDYICELYKDNLEEKIKQYILPKDALFYLSYRSLELFEETNELKYFVIPYEYYTYVSHMRTSPYPHMLHLRNKGPRWFNDFRRQYENISDKPETKDFVKAQLPEEEILLAWDILKPGMVERELRDVSHRAQANPDYAKYQKLFEMKMNYYTQNRAKKYLKGLYGLLGYVGFSYSNEYLVFDKFHNSETIDPSKRTILTHGEAIYALPSDRFEILSTDKQQVNNERANDDRIKKINHTINGSFINRLDNVVKGPNLSTSTLEDEIEKNKTKILIKR